MSNKLAITVSGKHQLGSKAYLTVNSMHRKVRKAYLTVDGKHELCYTAGTEWKKFSCNKQTVNGGYVQDDKNVGATSNTTKNKSGKTRLYQSYSFSSSSGFSGSGVRDVPNYALGNGYSVSSTAVRTFSFVSETDTTITYQMQTIASASATYYTVYSKGSTEYGKVYTEGSAYPDADIGYTYVTTFTEGGVKYTVMKDGSTYYCYCLA